MDAIRGRDPELASAIKGFMFVFDDLVHLTDRDIQRILTEVEQKDLALALKATSEELKAKIMRNMSERAAGMIQEEIELMGPVKVRDVEEAQQRIIETVHTLEEQEEISLSHTSDEVVI
jgi:flagellar motor switch protein FliG